MKVRLLRSALEDLTAGQLFYDQQELGVGNWFSEAIISEIDALEENAGIHPIRLGYHRLLTKRFPYAVYYRIIAGEAVIFRILDCRRDPKRIRRALSRSS